MNLDPMRPGQRLAYTVIWQRVIEREKYTAIVLPTRYGKSDVARVSAIELFQKLKISTTLILSPNEILRDQIVDKDKMNEMFARYSIKARGLKYTKMAKLVPRPNANDEFLISSSIQLVERNVDFFADWVESMLHRTGRPVLIAVDESHTGSEENSWGQAVKVLVDAGALAVLFTATAMRSDGKPPVGFDYAVVDEMPVRIIKTRQSDVPEKIRVELYAGVKRLLKLQPHHETTFRDAWSESPSPLCKVGRVPFDVRLREVLGAEFGEHCMLSHLSPTETRRWLGKIVRDGYVIREGAKRHVQSLSAFRRINATAAGIVFCGNDTDPDSRVNEHAIQIKAAILAFDPSLRIVIATSSDGNEGKGVIERFRAGDGDVLIVKQMASLGLDVKRLKVALDLSPVRTPAAFIQRLMRIATPFDAIRHGVYISLDDCLSRALFEDMVADSGGASAVDDLTLKDAYDKDREDTPERPTFIVHGVDAADFEDSHHNRADKEKLAGVNFLLDRFPELSTFMSHAEIANRLGDALSPVLVDDQAGPCDTSTEADELRADANLAVKGIASARLRGQPYSSQAYGETVKEVWNEVYRAAGTPPGTSLDRITELETLRRIKAAAETLRDGLGEVA